MIESVLNLLPYQLVVIGIALLWVDYVLAFFSSKRLNKPPFNCTLCLTFWGSLMLGLGNLSVLTSLEFIYLITVTPLLLRYIEARL